MDEPGKNIAADRVGAERISDRSALLPEGGLEKGRIVGEDRGMRRNEIGEEREYNQNHDHDEARHGAEIRSEIEPDFQQRMRRSACLRHDDDRVFEDFGGHLVYRMRGLISP